MIAHRSPSVAVRVRRPLLLASVLVGGLLLAPPAEGEAQSIFSVSAPECPGPLLPQWMCGPFGEAHAFASGFANNVTSIVNGAASTFQEYVDGVAGTIIPPNTIQRFNDAVELAQPITNGMQEVLDHPVCGSEAALGDLQAYFGELAQTALAMEELGQQILAAGVALTPIWDAGDGVLNEVGSIMEKPWVPGSESDRARRELESAAEDLGETLLKIGSKEGLKAVLAGIDAGYAAVKIHGFAGACGVCVQSIAGSVSGAIGAGTSAAVGTSCPATAAAAGGTCWAALPGGGKAVVAGVSFLVANATCGAVAAGLAEMPGAVYKIAKFAMASWELMQALAETEPMARAVHDAAVALGHIVGEESAGEIAAISAHLNEIGAAANTAIEILGPVANDAVQLASQTLEQSGDRVMQLIECHNMMQGVASSVSQEMLAVISDSLDSALSNMVTGAAVLEVVVESASAATQASTSAAQSEFQEIQSELQGLVSSLWGPFPNDPAQVALHLAAFATNPAEFNTLIARVASLSGRYAQLAEVALTAGWTALSSIESEASSAHDWFATARVTNLRAVSVLSQPPNPPMMAHAPMVDPGFGGEPTAVAWNGPILPLAHGDWSIVPVSSTRGTLRQVDPAATLKGHLDELQAIRFRQIVDPRGGGSSGTDCLNCPRQFELGGVKGALDRAQVRGAVELVVLDPGGATLFSMGTFNSAGAIPTDFVMQPPRGGFPSAGRGCSLAIEVRGQRGEPLARSSVCLTDR